MDETVEFLQGAARGDAATVSALIDAHPHLVRVAGDHGKTALHWAAESDRSSSSGEVKHVIAELLLEAEHELVQKATGSWLREAGKKDQRTLVRFLEKHAARMPSTTLRYATEKLGKDLRGKFIGVKSVS